ncbi:hypothetical protein AXF42_Ash002833 [Apostasia shenzhenica]|uniref:Vacuolar protein sorting-associated protein 13 VPS13 adaptor binding domain-containing protein n=1 Tax=Apostasia shenzhenica TaxID=1088818 RepID=A0A2I0A7F2_9ASPA|nr:hypothetical protein AXF42_Ash002833 [Apostasia shenzhenica]
MWWQYALNSVLADVRQKLQKTSWCSLGKRIVKRRKYINLYSRKLQLLQQEQVVNKDILLELEEMDRELDIDDILNYRSIAEQSLQELFSTKSPPMGTNDGRSSSAQEKQQNDEKFSVARGWLNWLSLGMLGAGGTADSNSFAGVVSDEIIKDIYEATEFHHVRSFSDDTSRRDSLLSTSVRLNICQIGATVFNKRGRKIVEAIFSGISVEAQFHEDSYLVIALINSLKLFNPFNGNAVLFANEAVLDNSSLPKLPFLNVHFNMGLPHQSFQTSVTVVIQPCEATYESEFLLELLDFFDALASFQFQHERVLISLNGLFDFKQRLLSKAEYILHNRRKVKWDVVLHSFVIKFAFLDDDAETSLMSLELKGASFRSVTKIESVPNLLRSNQCYNCELTSFLKGIISNGVHNLQLQDFYYQFELDTAFKVNMLMPNFTDAVSIIEKCNPRFGFHMCIFSDEPTLKPFEVSCAVTYLGLQFSPTILHKFMRLYELSERKSTEPARSSPSNGDFDKTCHLTSTYFTFSLKLNHLKVHVDLEDDVDYDAVILFNSEKVVAKYTEGELTEVSCFMEKFSFDALNTKGQLDCLILCSNTSSSHESPAIHSDHVGPSLQLSDSESLLDECCFQLYYKAYADINCIRREYSIVIGEVDFHVYPKMCFLLQRFFDKIGVKTSAATVENTVEVEKPDNSFKRIGSEYLKFGFSNLFASDPAMSGGISMDHFPFVTSLSSGSLSNINNSIIHGVNALQNLCMINRRDHKNYKSNSKRRSGYMNNLSTRTLNCTAMDDLHVSNSFDVSLLDVNLNKVKAYFHDSSCILYTVTVPQTLSSISFQCATGWEVLVSIGGLCLSSSWSFHEILLGSVSSSISPVFNIRAKKDKEKRMVEISFSLQHVLCILTSEFLAMLIGYFSLPDWTCKGYEQYSNLTDESGKYQKENLGMLCKFEVFESILILPVENQTFFCLKVNIPRFYCSFSPTGNSEDAFVDIPGDYVAHSTAVTKEVHIINFFWRHLSLSLVLLNDDTGLQFRHGEYVFNKSIPFIEQFDADMWVRIPCRIQSSVECSDVTALIMMNVDSCKLAIVDEYFFVGLEATVNVADQLSLVSKESELFSSDVFQFLQLKRKIKEEAALFPDIVVDSFLIIKIHVNALATDFTRLSVKQSTSLGTIAKACLKLDCSATLKNGTLMSLDMHISSLLLHSFQSDMVLVSFVSEGDISHICINFSKSVQKDDLILLVVPAVDIWLHLQDWVSLIAFLMSFSTKETSETCSHTSVEHHDLYSDVSESVKHEAISLTIKSENMLMSFHLPLWSMEEHSYKSEVRGSQLFHELETGNDTSAEDLEVVEPRPCRYVKLVLQSKLCEFSLGKSHLKLKCNVEKIRIMLEMVEKHELYPIPFIYISQVKLEGEILLRGVMQIVLEVQVESADVALSYHVLKFWSHSKLKVPDGAPSVMLSRYIDLKVRLMKAALLLSDGRLSFHGPILEILLKNMVIQSKQTEDSLEGSVITNLLINYNNIDKVMWEPFVEPWSLRVSLSRKDGSITATTNVYIESNDQLNFNITEPLIEAIFRLLQMVDDALNKVGLLESQRTIAFPANDDIHIRRYAPYILQNDTSLPLNFHVSRGPISTQDMLKLVDGDGQIVQPGFSVPIYVEETFDEHFFQHKASHSSELLIEKKLNASSHHMISIQFDGTSGPSNPMSIDMVGLSCFEVNFSRSNQSRTAEPGLHENALKFSWKIEEKDTKDHCEGLVVPVVFEVSMLHYSKMIRLYSTVILFNATSMPLELRFDIPFGVSPKILDPIQPGQELPLPLHLAEAGRVRWRPVGANYLWSEAQSLPDILHQGNRPIFLRSFVCYPSHPASDPFRCCIAVQDFNLSSLGNTRKYPHLIDNMTEKLNVKNFSNRLHKETPAPKHPLHQIRLITPLLVKNYLPICLLLKLESGGTTHSMTLTEGNSASCFAVDSTHDLDVTCMIHGYRPAVSKFPRADSFSMISKSIGSKYFVLERLSLYPHSSDSPLHVTLEKTVDVSCGAREVSLSVSYLLYNCTGLLLGIIDGIKEHNGSPHVIPSSYELLEYEQLADEKQGLAFLSSESTSSENYLSKYIVSNRKKAKQFSPTVFTSSVDGGAGFIPAYSLKKLEDSSESISCGFSKRTKPYMYAPSNHISTSEFLVRLAVFSSSQIRKENMFSSTWSTPFPLVPTSGSTNITIPKPNASSAFLISTTSVPVSDELSGRTRAIMFQPRYVICNACSKGICYKQKGTNNAFYLRVGQHYHLHWPDTSRELLVSLRFNEIGWQWSGSFLPDCLGDAQVKMHNYVSGELNMVRVEVQNADMALSDDKLVANSDSGSSTQLILLSDDNTGFMPYRIDNFSMERLRIYQQKCEAIETVVHPYTSCKYAWDEPCYPHRIIVEVPGERIVGTYNFDNVKEFIPVSLPSTFEKPERRLSVSVHAEGAIKVLSIVDSSYHVIRDVKGSNFLGFRDNRKADHQKQCHEAHLSEVITLHLPYVGISLISSTPQELIFASARESTVVFMHSTEQQRISTQILSLQIDNQLSDTPYPIMVSFDNDSRGKSLKLSKRKENRLHFQQDTTSTSNSVTFEPIFHFAAAKWTKPDVSLVSFQYITLRLAPLSLELEEQILLYLFDFFRTVNSRVQRSLQKTSEHHTLGSYSDASQMLPVGQSYLCGEYSHLRTCVFKEADGHDLLPSVVPVGAPWQQIYLLAKSQRKIYIEVFELAPIKLSLSFSSTPWIIRNEVFAEVENFTHMQNTAFQRGIMALVDVEGVPVHLRQLTLEHLMASPESIHEILVRHYMRQLLQELYKLFGSAGVIGNPIGFARNVGLGIKDFISVSSSALFQSPFGLLTGVAEGSKSLLSNTIYALSSATSQFSKAAHKGIVAFTFDEQTVAEKDTQLQSIDLHGKGVLNEFLEGLTGLLQSPIRGAEKHGLPGVLSGIAMGTTGLVARPVASILEATAKTAQSIRNRSNPHLSNCRRLRLPRPLARDLPLSPYSWEEAIGVSLLQQADGTRLKNEVFVMCKALKQAGRFVVISEGLVLVVWCSFLVDLGSPDFSGVSANPTWAIEKEINLKSVVLVDRAGDEVNVVGSNTEIPSRLRKGGTGHRSWGNPTSTPFLYLSMEFRDVEEAEDVLQVLLSTIESGKEKRWGVKVIHRSNLG